MIYGPKKHYAQTFVFSLFVLLLGPDLKAQAWELVGGSSVSPAWGVSGSLAIDPTSHRPFVTFQENGAIGSRTKQYTGSSWVDSGSPLSYGTGWYHETSFVRRRGSNVLSPIVFLRDYGWTSNGLGPGDGTLSIWDGTQWQRSTSPANISEIHHIGLTVPQGIPTSSFENTPIVSFADRANNALWPAIPGAFAADPLSVRKYDLNAAPPTSPWSQIGTAFTSTVAFQQIGPGQIAPVGPATFTSPRVSPNGELHVAYCSYSYPQGQGHVNVLKLDEATDTFVQVGNANASAVQIGNFPVTSAQSLTLEFDRVGVPWIAFHYYLFALVMRLDQQTNQWVLVGGPASGPDFAALYDNPNRYRLGLAFDSLNRPHVLYTRWAVSPQTDAKAVVRLYSGGQWNEVAPGSLSPNGASYLSLKIDRFDNILACYRDTVSGLFRVMRYRNPLLVGGPTTTAAPCGTNPALPLPLLLVPQHPTAGQTFLATLSQASPQRPGAFFVGPMAAVGSPIGNTACSWSGQPESTNPFQTFMTDAAGGTTLSFVVPLGVEPVPLTLGALILDGSDLQFSNQVGIVLLPLGGVPW